MQYEREGDISGTTGSDRVTGFEGTGTANSGGFQAQGDGATPKAEQMKARAKDAASQIGHRAADKIEDRAQEQKSRATHQLEDFARSLRVAGEQLPSDNGVSRYMGLAATQVDNIASFLNNNDVADLVDDVEQFARRQPALFVGGAFAAGMLGARFLKSSRRNLVDEGVRDRWDTDELTDRVRDPEWDAVSRPEAPGYAAPAERGDGNFGNPGNL